MLIRLICLAKDDVGKFLNILADIFDGGLRVKSDFLDFSLPQVEQFLQDTKLCSSRRIGGRKS